MTETQLPPSLDDIDAMAQRARATLPEPFRAGAAQVAVVVEDWPDEALLEALGVENAYELTGLYTGIPMTQKSVMDQPMGPDIVQLFRRPILDEWAERGDVSIEALVAHVLVHEIAHHFGWSDDDIASIDRWWE